MVTGLSFCLLLPGSISTFDLFDMSPVSSENVAIELQPRPYHHQNTYSPIILLPTSKLGEIGGRILEQ
jgi:hypothetical protein